MLVVLGGGGGWLFESKLSDRLWLIFSLALDKTNNLYKSQRIFQDKTLNIFNNFYIMDWLHFAMKGLGSVLARNNSFFFFKLGQNRVTF